MCLVASVFLLYDLTWFCLCISAAMFSISAKQIKVIMIIRCNNLYLRVCSSGCVKQTLAAPAWWAWVRAAVCVCGSSGPGGPPGCCRPPRARAGSWLDGGERERCWLDITTETSPCTATVRLLSTTNKTFWRSDHFYPKAMSAHRCVNVYMKILTF